MEVTSLPISASHRSKLISAGYTSIASLSSISTSQLARGMYFSHLSHFPSSYHEKKDTFVIAISILFYQDSFFLEFNGKYI